MTQELNQETPQFKVNQKNKKPSLLDPETKDLEELRLVNNGNNFQFCWQIVDDDDDNDDDDDDDDELFLWYG